MRTTTSASVASIETWYSWVVGLSVAYTNAIVFGWTFVSSILLRELEQVYSNDPEVVFKGSWVISVQVAVSCCASVFAAYFVRQFGVRPVGYAGVLLGTLSVAVSPFTSSIDWWYFTYSFLNGAACACIYIVFCVVQPMYFDIHRGLNFGIVCFASGVASFVYPPVWFALRSALDFQYSMLVIALGFASTAISVTAMRPRVITPTTGSHCVELPPANSANSASTQPTDRRPSIPEDEYQYEPPTSDRRAHETNAVDEETISSSDREQIIGLDYAALNYDEYDIGATRIENESRCSRLSKHMDVHLLRNRSFLLFAVAIGLISCGTSIPQTHLISFSALYYPTDPIDLLISAMGITQAVSKLVSAALVDRIPLRFTLFLIQAGPVCCMVTMVVISFLITAQVPFVYLVTATAIYGVFEGPSIATIYPFVCRVVQLNEVGSANAYLRVLMGIGGLIGPPVGGAIYSSLYSYSIGFYVATIPVLLGSLLIFLAKNFRDLRT